jgi:hypothetical protein
MSKKVPVIWVSGHRKCGTTLLTNLLDGHSEIANFSIDVRLLYAYRPLLQHFKTNIEKRQRLLTILSDERSDNGLLGVADMVRIVGSLRDESLNDVWEIISVFSRELNKFGTPLFKETTSEVYAEEIANNFDAKFIHMIRDPRDNFAAIYSGVSNYYSKFGEDDFHALASTINRIRIGYSFLRSNAKRISDYLVIKFEDLVKDQRVTMEEISEFLEIGQESILYQPTIGGVAYGGNSHDGLRHKGINDSNTGRWKSRIPDWHAKVIEFLLMEEMDYFGYKTHYNEVDAKAAASEFYDKYNATYFYYDKFGDIEK